MTLPMPQRHYTCHPLRMSHQTIDTTTIDAQFGVPDHLEHRLTTEDGRTLAVAEWGDPNGKPVITFHGTPGSRIGYWTPEPLIWARFGLRRFRLYPPGYGATTPPPGPQLPAVGPR